MIFWKTVLVVALCVLSGCERSAVDRAPGSVNEETKNAATPSQTSGEFDRLAISGIPQRSNSKVEIAEFFSYACPHCYTLEPHIVLMNRYKENYIEIVRIPAAWRPEQRAHARLFYALRALGREDLHEAVFDAIHREGNSLTESNDAATIQKQADFAGAHGINRDDFKRVYASDTVTKQVLQAEQLAKTYRIDGVPTLVINGRYSTDAAKTKGNEGRVIQVALELAEQENQEMSASTKQRSVK